MNKIEQNMSIQIVVNEKVTCGNCLISAKIGQSEMVTCGLTPDPKEKHKSQFCAQGLWLIDSMVMTFKEAFKYNYDQNANKILGE